MAKKPLGPEGARFKKSDWNPQDTGAKRTYLDERTALEKRVADLEKVNGITVATVQVEPAHLKGDGPHVVRYLVDDGARFAHEFYRHDDKALTKFADELVAREVAVPRSDLLEKLPALKAVAVIKSADGECFVTMPQTGIFRPLLPDLSPVKVGDAIFAVQVDSDLYTRERRSLIAMMKAAMRSAITFRRSSEFTPEQIQELRSRIFKLESENRSLNHKIEKNSQAVQAADDTKKGLGCLLIGGLIGWLAALGLYLYSDLPIRFVGDDEASENASAGISPDRVACIQRSVETDTREPQRLIPMSTFYDGESENIVNLWHKSDSSSTTLGMRASGLSIQRRDKSLIVEFDILNPVSNPNGNLTAIMFDIRMFDFSNERCQQIGRVSKYEPLTRTLALGEKRAFRFYLPIDEAQTDGTPIMTAMAFLADGAPPASGSAAQGALEGSTP